MVFIACILVQIACWAALFAPAVFARSRRAPDPAQWPFVSVVICARNECANLEGFLPAVLTQDYPGGYEVLVVDHASTDGTGDLLRRFAASYPLLKPLRQEEGGPLSGKKAPLLAGIQAARGPLLALTDADCRPAGQHWLRELTRPLLDPAASVCLGFGGYTRQPGWLNRFIRYETLYVALQYFSMARAGQPYMGVGRNLAYRRSAFAGFGPGELLSGDDDLAVSRMARGHNTRWTLDPASFTWSVPAQNWRGYFRAKDRHFTTGRYYRPLHQVVLALIALSLAGSWLAFATPLWPWAALRLALSWPLAARFARRIQSPDLGWWFPLLDLGMVLLYLRSVPAIFFRRPKAW